MATYVNDLRLKEIATGDEAGTWGTSTNTNLELFAEAFSFGTESITTNADTHTTTIADGSTDPGRSIYLQYTGTLDSTCTITIGPNTVSKLWFIENATSGSQSIIIKQGSGATVTIRNGDVKAIYSDGAGSGGKMVDAFTDLHVNGLTSEVDDNEAALTVRSTDADASLGPLIVFDRESSSPADGDLVGRLILQGKNDAGEDTTYARIHAGIVDASDGTEDGLLQLASMLAGTVVSRMEMNATETVFNDGSKDLDFRVESDGNANMLFVDAGNNRVLIGTNTPVTAFTTAAFQVSGTSNAPSTMSIGRFSDNANAPVLNFIKSRNASVGGNTIVASGDNLGLILFNGNDGVDSATSAAKILGEVDGTPGSNDMPGRLVFSTTPDGSSSTSEVMRIDSSGNVGIGTSSPDALLHISSAGSTVLNVEATGSNDSRVRITAANTNISYIEFADPDDADTGEIRYVHSTNNMQFRVNGNAEAMRIDSSGNVGIGTSSPASLVSGGSSPVLSIGGTDSGLTTGEKAGALSFITSDGSYTGTYSDGITGEIVSVAESSTGGSYGLAFYTGTTSSSNRGERVRINASGRVLIGNSSALSVGSNMDFAIQGQDGGAGASIVRNADSSSGPSIQFAKSRGTAANATTVVQDGDTIGNISFRGADGTDLNTKGADIIAQVDGTPGSNAMPGRLLFRTNDSSGTLTSGNEVFRIDSNQTAHFGATAAINSTATRVNITGANRAADLYRPTSTGTSIVFAAFSDVGGTKTKVFEVECNGDIETATGSIGTISDQRLKQDIVDANSQWNDIKALQIRNFRFTNDVNQNGEDALRHIGVVAQEVESAGMTGLVKTRNDEDTGEEIKSVKSSIIYMKAVKALQEAITRIETLEAEVTALKGGG